MENSNLYTPTFIWDLHWDPTLLKFLVNLEINGIEIPCIVDTGSAHLILREEDIAEHPHQFSQKKALCAPNPIYLKYTGGSFKTMFTEIILKRTCIVPAGISLSHELPRASLWGLIPTYLGSRCPSSIECLLDRVSTSQNTFFPTMVFDLRKSFDNNANSLKMWLGKVSSKTNNDEMIVSLMSPLAMQDIVKKTKQSKFYIKLKNSIHGMRYLFLDTGTSFTKLPFQSNSSVITFDVAEKLQGPSLIRSEKQNQHVDLTKHHEGLVGTLGIFDMLGFQWSFIFKKSIETKKWEPFQLRMKK